MPRRHASSGAIGKHPRFPGWHHRQRRRRSALRGRIACARIAGRPVPKGWVALLQQHHSRPFQQRQFRVLAHMGKKAAWQQAPWKNGHGQGDQAAAWAYWPGSWRTRQSPKLGRGEQEDAWHSTSTVRFPSYSQIGESSQDMAHPPGKGVDPSVQEGGDPFVKTMQKLLNGSRKAEARLRKIRQDQAGKRQQWATFQEQLKAAFVEQRHQFQADMAKLDAELVEVEGQRRATSAQIQDLVAGGNPVTPTPAKDVQPSAEDAAAWHMLMSASPSPDPEQDVILRQALLAAQDPQAFLKEMGAPMLVESVQGAPLGTGAGVAGSSGRSVHEGFPAIPLPAPLQTPPFVTPVRGSNLAPPRSPGPHVAPAAGLTVFMLETMLLL